MKNRFLKEVLITSFELLLVLVIAFCIVKYVGQRTAVIGSSMESTLSNKDQLIVEKISYRMHDPERFDIIVFPYRFDRKTYYIKRVIGLPGEKVQIDRDGRIFINDEVLEESYGREVIEYTGRATTPIYLGDDEYFVMGDNRNNSSDSRMEDVGDIKKDDIIGRAVYRIWPFSKFGKIE